MLAKYESFIKLIDVLCGIVLISGLVIKKQQLIIMLYMLG